MDGARGGRERREALILTVARRLFEERGYGSTGMREIGLACDLGAGSLYHYYPTKADLLAAVLASYLDGACRALGEAVAPVRTPGARLREVVRRHVTLCMEAPATVLLLLSERHRLQGQARLLVEEQLQRYRSIVTAAVEAAAAAAPRDTAAVTAAADLVLALGYGLAAQGAAFPASAVGAYAELACSLVDGLAAGAGTPRPSGGAGGREGRPARPAEELAGLPDGVQERARLQEPQVGGEEPSGDQLRPALT